VETLEKDVEIMKGKLSLLKEKTKQEELKKDEKKKEKLNCLIYEKIKK